MKKLLVLLLALMLLAVCGVCLAEDEVLVENDYSYIVLEDGTVRIYQYDTFNDKETVKIPAKLGGKQVTELGDWSFSGCTAVKVVIPEGVKTIGEGAFSFADALETITILASVTEIGPYAFQDCASLTAVVIPGPVKELGDEAFSGCGALTSVKLGEGMESIGQNCFLDCAAMETLSLPSTLKMIDFSAFDGCASLTTVVLPEGIETIETYAFNNCTGLESINLPASLTYIGNAVFEACDAVVITLVENSYAEIICESFGYAYEYAE